MGKRTKINVNCDNCSKEYELNQETYNRNISRNKKNLCISCRHIKDLDVGVKKSNIRPKENLMCGVCNKPYTMTISKAEERRDRFGEDICISCAKKEHLNPFYNKTFDKNKLKELSDIRKSYYNDPKYGQLRREEQRLRFEGENNPMYIGSQLKSDYTWRSKTYRFKILRLFNYTCIYCNNKYDEEELRAHHLNSCDWDIIGRNDLKNGVCICNDCHKKFHSKYGYGKNTEEQFNKWMNERSETSV